MDDMFDAFMQTPSTVNNNVMINNSFTAPNEGLFEMSDPAADFLASQQAELRKIENIGSNDPYGAQSLDFNNNQDKVKENSDLFSNNWSNPVLQPEAQVGYSFIADMQSGTDKFSIWKEEQKKRLAEKDAEEERKKKELRETAKRELDELARQRKELLEKIHAQYKQIEIERHEDDHRKEPGKEWEKVAKFCDFTAKRNGRDVNRMRGIMLSLKQTPLIR